MNWLLTIVSVFVVWHVLPSSSAGQALRLRLGRLFGPVFGIISLLLFLLLLWSHRIAERVSWYEPPVWGAYANYGFTLLAFICLGIFVFRGHLRNVLRYPLALGAVLWAVGHLFNNGDGASVTLILGLLITVLISTYMRGPPAASEVRQGHDLLGPLFGVAFYAVAVQMHQALVGVPVFQLLK